MVAVLTGADPAFAKRLGYYAIDGNQIRYEINSRFGDEARFAAAAWNKIGRIAIQQGGSRPT